MSDVDWAEFFESVSLVDDALRAAQRLRADGFRDAQPLPQRHRGAGARLDAVPSCEIAQRVHRRPRRGDQSDRASAIPAIT